MNRQWTESWSMNQSESSVNLPLHQLRGQDDRIGSFGSATTIRRHTWPLVHETALEDDTDWHPQRRLQERAIFVRDFWSLRRQCLRSTEWELRALEREIETIKDPETEAEALKRAAALLHSLDSQVKHEFDLLQISDPQFASERGLSIVHFEIGDRHEEAGNWMMLANKVGKEASCMYDDVHEKQNILPKLHKKQIERFAGRGIDTMNSIHIKRSKTILERQPGVFIENPRDHIPHTRPAIIFWWKVAFALACFAWAGFFGVGVISTNTTFSPIFVKFFFWIAILWTFMPTALLAWMVRAWGGTAGDTLMASMASLGIWLVIIQIGQTHLAAQLRGNEVE